MPAPIAHHAPAACVDRWRVRQRHRQSLAMLAETAACFDELFILDNSDEATGQPEPTTALVLEHGQVSYATDQPWREQLRSRNET